MLSRRRFRPEQTVFHHSSKIDKELLRDVVKCYTKGRTICKACYYRRNLTRPIKYQDGYMYCDECRKHCESLWFIPASKMCHNFGNFSDIPIPKSAGAYRRRTGGKPFEICKKDDHFNCYQRSANSEIWFAHTIEELVVWTIEREYKCSFKEYIEKYYYNGRKVKWENDHKREEEEKEKEETFTGDIRDEKLEGRGHDERGYTLFSPSFDLDEFQDLSFTGGIYDPEKIEVKFKSIKDIPQNLLEDIARSYKKSQEVCKFCFFCRFEEVKKPLDSRGFSPACLRCKSHWQSVKVIPASSLCSNFNKMKKVSISIPVIKPSNTQIYHSYCSESDHKKCFKDGYYKGFSHAHSIEELIVWIVERESSVGYGNFEEYMKDNQLGGENIEPKTATPTKVNKSIKYDPDKCLFSSISQIPLRLLHSISHCYNKRTNVCRTCYFDSLVGTGFNSDPALTRRDEGTKMCERGHLWRSLRVVPSSLLCDSYGVYIAIPPVPKHMQISKSPFKVCSMADHTACFEKTRENNPWFPHTVEEMVIWTVERETGKDFQFYQELIETDDNRANSPDHHSDILTTPTLSQNDKSPKNNNNNNKLSQSSGNNLSGYHGNETTPLLFTDDLSSSSSGVLGVAYNKEDASLLLGEGLTIDEANRFFPALVGGDPVINDLIKVPSSYQQHQASNTDMSNSALPSITTPLPPPNLINNHLISVTTQSLYQQQPYQVPLSTISKTNQPVYQPGPTSMPSYQPTSIPSYHQPVSTSLTPQLIQPPVSSLSLKPSFINQTPPGVPPLDQLPGSSLSSLYQAFSQPVWSHPLRSLKPPGEPLVDLAGNQLQEQLLDNDSSNDDVLLFECYLCYREFDTPREIAEHCMKDRHLDIVRQDGGSSCLWSYHPPPPDQVPDEFKLCQKSHKCQSKLRCCKAHSIEELQEWHVRYRHRQQQLLYKTTPTQLISMATINKPYQDYKLVSISIGPSHHTMVSARSSVTWTLDVTGQGWQTLMGVVCTATVVAPLTIVSIKGDTIYSIFPRSSKWVAPSFKEGILLGTVSIIIKTTPTISGFNEHSVRLYLGSVECLDISLKVLCQ